MRVAAVLALLAICVWLLSRLPGGDPEWFYSADNRRREHPDGRVQVWDDEDMDAFHGGFWRDAD